MMIYVPMSHHGATALRSGHNPGPGRGCAATPSLVQALGADSTTDEADFAALSNAGVLALLLDTDPQRLVLALEVEPAQVTDRQTHQGEVDVTGLRWSQVESLFTDEPAAVEPIGTARRAVGVGGGLAEALATPAVQQLLDAHDLLWFAVDELDGLG